MRCVGVYVLLESLVPFLSDVLESCVPFLSDDQFTTPAAVTVEEKNGIQASALPPQTDGGSRAAAGVAEKLSHFFWRDWRSTIVQIVVYSIY